MTEPTKKQRAEWVSLLDRYAASDDAEQNMVVDIVNHLSEQLDRAKKGSDQNLKTGRFVQWAVKQYQRREALYVQAHQKTRQEQADSGSAGGKAYEPYAAAHDLAEKLYWEDSSQAVTEVATYVYGLVVDTPAEFNFPASRKVSHRTILNELYRRARKRTT